MPQKKKKPQYPDGDSIRLDPDWTEMGVRVLDNCAEENEK